MPYVSPRGGDRTPTPKPGPVLGRVSRVAWRQPVGGVRSTAPSVGRR